MDLGVFMRRKRFRRFVDVEAAMKWVLDRGEG
jgi:hypothetical protein